MKKIERIKDKAIIVIVYLITIILAVLLLMSCEEEHQPKKIVDGYEIIVVDSCEYLILPYYKGGVMSHKGNCRFCAERNKRMVHQQVDSILLDIFE